MKTSLCAIILLLAAHAFGQGYLNFANIGGGPAGTVNAPITNCYVTPCVRASGSTVLAMLYIGPAGTTDESLLSTNGVEGPPSSFATGAQAGYFLGGKRIISGYNPGDTITVQVRYWIASASSNWEGALGFRDESNLIQVTLAGEPEQPPNLVGLMTFIMSPEPPLTVWVFSWAVPVGSNVTFFASSFGYTPTNYRWRFNGTDIPGATNQSLSLTNVQLTDAGSYSVFVQSCCGSATGTGTLQVLVPALLTDLHSFPNSFSFTVTGTTGRNYVVQSATTLVPTNWTPRLTNVAPFTFTESNSPLQPQRFYRALLR
jgi:hypothetical protein